MWVARRISTPHAGKTEIVKARMRTAAGIIARNGALGVSTMQVTAGHGAGTMQLLSFVENMSHGSKVSMAVQTDPSWAALMADRESSPAAEVVGPDLARLVAGTPNPANKAMMVREYVMGRENLQAAVAMVPDLQKLTSSVSVNTTMWAPVIGSEMNRVSVVYSAADLGILGNGVDEVGMSDAFQALVTEAAKLGTLDRSFLMTAFQ
jgi:hypothetical protein